MLLELLRAAFPMCSSTIPSSFYEAKRKLRDLVLGYETIHACKYDCVLYWKEFANLQHCPTCGETRYKVNHNRGKKILHKATEDAHELQSQPTPEGTLQETGVLPTHKYVDENAKYVGKGYPDVQNGVGKNVGRNASREDFSTLGGFTDAGRCVGIDGLPLVKLMLGDFYFVLQFVPKLHEV
ncbi:hypothetical protein E6C27_scaffold24G003250 [Cucumis melo var. makuwa]|uniref:Uncharacterized protein n=1 Tax=Cucumis melo var. makuwa TaxID=1194695 RepID=A0A5A7ULY2_CUCMM|nr:hypothetical protein E6C27_scaffold24G003250 [Cucumis melo var. makuwa]